MDKFYNDVVLQIRQRMHYWYTSKISLSCVINAPTLVLYQLSFIRFSNYVIQIIALLEIPLNVHSNIYAPFYLDNLCHYGVWS